MSRYNLSNDEIANKIKKYEYKMGGSSNSREKQIYNMKYKSYKKEQNRRSNKLGGDNNETNDNIYPFLAAQDNRNKKLNFLENYLSNLPNEIAEKLEKLTSICQGDPVAENVVKGLVNDIKNILSIAEDNKKAADLYFDAIQNIDNTVMSFTGQDGGCGCGMKRGGYKNIINEISGLIEEVKTKNIDFLRQYEIPGEELGPEGWS